MSQEIEFYSVRQGPNPWKTVIVFEELGIPYTTHFLEFGNDKNGVTSPDHLKRNATGRVPLIRDPQTGITLTESNAISEYLVDRYDTIARLAVQGPEEPYLVKKWLGFQASTQAPFCAQVIQLRNKNNPDAVAHFQGLVKRTLQTVDQELAGKEYLVGSRLTLADLAFIPWDLVLDVVLQGDPEASTADLRKELYPNWFRWHSALLKIPAVQRMIALQKEANQTK